MPAYYFSSDPVRRLRRAKLKGFILGGMLCAIVFGGLGAGVTWLGIKKEYLTMKAQYETDRAKVADLETKVGILQGKNIKKR